MCLARAGRGAQARYNGSGARPYVLRRPEQIAGFLTGPDPVPPGVVPLPNWRPDPSYPAPVRWTPSAA
ncbi:SAM-dependent methyltransferase [Actinomadura harenae]|uniref:SAM-dependent methyltransferase n=1 Tax=Actinomadura harenae TaxID=2483351 RepID=UPI0018F53147